MVVLSGKEVANSKLEELKSKTQSFIEKYNRKPTLAVILVGEDPASQTYVASKKKACIKLGYGHKDYVLDKEVTQKELNSLVDALNEDNSVDGILVQMPLPKHLNEQEVIERIRSDKDVDGFHPINVGKLLIGLDCFVSCTPKGIMAILDYYHIETQSKNVVIIGRSNIVGKPMASLLIQKGRDATVTIAHSRTKNLKELTKSADILIAAIGRANFVTADMVKEDCVVIDVGINRVEDSSRKRGYRVVGDVDYQNVSAKVSAITPVPGGVGLMTIAMLMENTLESAIMHEEKDN
ncbi:MAG: bifunctional methylenetetrahydrofolate dehydrogenase/methenyltetrahydrofolate cyclohydrolase FolD [Sphaerochaetaceae bacterium]|jgi:methylenetetrahydrofolate dehydrogenase (NADP+)/methenyltetrahydrofolate cyclohydrolase|nr:bifunctional methylenetetrahydrofolate dehydrogenase/methenyltetrahydrofolate cyclohydrolase FolD [Sphaerochaetaceae bacterium]MDC7237939.1 bifunctional methylenetetrahydrofolate dehydrogenase/methenyltetrahydrofolate cyclohydrolase FolD [Sphaerochaetaceae bacterium]MDC7249604.1 bifunctional methylenetetrahydrofolate dehydrogenase/methenyltetrahydrofolate cyclohydrolase FolD [Sphaerochaetaceae bacterium]